MIYCKEFEVEKEKKTTIRGSLKNYPELRVAGL
jgi:hypothetical protein